MFKYVISKEFFLLLSSVNYKILNLKFVWGISKIALTGDLKLLNRSRLCLTVWMRETRAIKETLYFIEKKWGRALRTNSTEARNLNSMENQEVNMKLQRSFKLQSWLLAGGRAPSVTRIRLRVRRKSTPAINNWWAVLPAGEISGLHKSLI